MYKNKCGECGTTWSADEVTTCPKCGSKVSVEPEICCAPSTGYAPEIDFRRIEKWGSAMLELNSLRAVVEASTKRIAELEATVRECEGHTGKLCDREPEASK